MNDAEARGQEFRQGHWWLDRALVQGLVRGVFEGGGAKGALYAGALEGMRDRQLWFSAVAGSSAGAITAALVASGMTPDELRAQMKVGIDKLAAPRLTNAWRRLRAASGFLDHDAVRKWLRDVLHRQCDCLGAPVRGLSPTFDELYTATEIDLFVVAVDLTAGHVMVFNHALTPHVEVADAVMASATIPFAFEPLRFGVATKDGEARLSAHRLVADGGIAANFPTFVFRDAAFRAYAGLPPDDGRGAVVGFLLDAGSSGGEDTLDVHRRGGFAGAYHEVTAAVNEVPRFRRRRESLPGIAASVVGVLDTALYVAELALLTLVIWFASLIDRPATWNWPEPRNRHAGLWLTAARRWLSAAPGILLAGIMTYVMIFGIGFVEVAGWLWPANLPQGASEWATLVFAMLVGLAATVLAVWIFVLSLATLVLLRVALPVAGVLGHSLLQTFLHTPAAPPWAGKGPNETVIRLKVPEGLTTLRVSPEVDLDAELTNARLTTVAALESITAATLRPTRLSEPPAPPAMDRAGR